MRRLLFIGILICALGILSSAGATTDLRHIRVQLSLNASDDTPISGITYVLRVGDANVVAETNASGVAVFDANVDDAATTATIVFEDGSHAQWPRDEQARRWARIRELQQKNFYPPDRTRGLLTVALKPDQAGYEFTVRLQPAIRVSGVILDQAAHRPVRIAGALMR